jgi:hypothetical protein
LDQAVGQRRLAVVDVGDDREIADVLHAGAYKKGCLSAPFSDHKTLNISVLRSGMQ